ncbi:MAG TPA: hypothetical protein VEQ87_19000 [Burkholderiales bacterium]|nr:hypothetical protein [Burkholderiales bacterium]
MTQEKLLKAAGLGHEISPREAWKLFGIMAEFFDDTDCKLVQVVNEPREVVDAIFSFYEKRGFEPSPAEREVLLNL